MRPRGYSNSVRQPLFCISGPTQLPSRGPKLYTSFFLLSLSLFRFPPERTFLLYFLSFFFLFSFRYTHLCRSCCTRRCSERFSRLRRRAWSATIENRQYSNPKATVASYLSPQAYRLPSADPIDFMLRKDGTGKEGTRLVRYLPIIARIYTHVQK